MLRLVSLLLLVLAIGGTACRRDPQPMKPKEGELPPLPPASGSVVGYLIDNAAQLQLRDDQLEQLKAIDFSLAAKNDSIDTQLRTMERPAEQEAPKGQPPPRHNNAPGAQVHSTPAAQQLHKQRAENDRDAIEKAFAVLDAEQQQTARRLLGERGVVVPGSTKPEQRSSAEGTPVPGNEP